MPRRRRRQVRPIEWLIVVGIAAVLLAAIAPPRSSRGRSVRRSIQAPAARPPQPAMPVALPDAAKRAASPSSALRPWRRVQNPLALALALHVIGRALRRRPKPPITHESSPAP